MKSNIGFVPFFVILIAGFVGFCLADSQPTQVIPSKYDSVEVKPSRPELNSDEYWRRVYAANALQGMCANSCIIQALTNKDLAAAHLSRTAFDFADCMVEQQNKGK